MLTHESPDDGRDHHGDLDNRHGLCVSAAVSVVLDPLPCPCRYPDACQPIDISAPSGERVDLTGTWESGGLLFYIYQDADYPWIVGGNSASCGAGWALRNPWGIDVPLPGVPAK